MIELLSLSFSRFKSTAALVLLRRHLTCGDCHFVVFPEQYADCKPENAPINPTHFEEEALLKQRTTLSIHAALSSSTRVRRRCCSSTISLTHEALVVAGENSGAQDSQAYGALGKLDTLDGQDAITQPHRRRNRLPASLTQSLAFRSRAIVLRSSHTVGLCLWRGGRSRGANCQQHCRVHRDRFSALT